MGIRSTRSFWGAETGIDSSLPHSPAQGLAGILLWKQMALGHRGHILGEPGPKQEPWPYVFFSRQLTPTERNYDIWDKEHLKIKAASEEW